MGPRADSPLAWWFDRVGDTWTWVPVDTDALPWVEPPTPGRDPGKSLDTPHKPAGRAPRVALREVFATLRRHGVEPHPGGEAEDARYAVAMARALAPHTRATAGDLRVTPLPFLGVTESVFPRVSPVTPEGRATALAEGGFHEDAKAQMGDCFAVLGDLAAMGCGRVRRLLQCDLTHGAVFPIKEGSAAFYHYGEAVPPPTDIRDVLTRGRYAAFSATTALVLEAWLLGVRLDLTAFLGMGGMRLSVNSEENARTTVASSEAATATDVAGGDLTVGDLRRAAPAWQTGLLIPSGLGWDGFYYDDPTAPSPVPADWTTPTDEDRNYQKFCLSVWPTRRPDSSGTDVTPERTPYHQECARRKCLAVVAWGRSVGAWLEALNGALVDLGGTGITAVVDTIELANEPDGYWETDTTTDEAVQAAREVGRYLALLAANVQASVPEMRFRVELHDWHDVAGKKGVGDNFQEKVDWLQSVLLDGMAEEVAWWDELGRGEILAELAARGLPYDGARAPEMSVPALEWFATCTAAGIRWPLPSYAGDLSAASDAELYEILGAWSDRTAVGLLHQVGYHFYHHKDRDRVGGDTTVDTSEYAGSSRMAADIATLQAMADHAARYGHDLDVTVGEIAFPAHWPGLPATYAGPDADWGAGYYEGATPLLQAAMYLRLLLTCAACDIWSAKLYTFRYGSTQAASAYDRSDRAYLFYDDDHADPSVPTMQWGEYTTTGVRNDVAADPSGAYTQAADCWPRPAWYTFQRLAWLLALAGNGAASTRPVGVRKAYDADGVFAVEIEFTTDVYTGPDGVAFKRGPWRRAYVLWLDQYEGPAGDLGMLTFEDPDQTYCQGLSLVPDVVPQAGPDSSGAYEVDGRGYGTPAETFGRGRNPDWSWFGSGDVVDRSRSDSWSFGGRFTLALRRTDATGAVTGRVVIAPLCILTNGYLP